MFCQNSPLWPVHLGWPCTAWLIASLSYARLWSMWPFWLVYCYYGPDAGKDWGQEEKGATEDEMVGWHHRLNGHEFEQTLGDGEGERMAPGVLQSTGVAKNWTTTTKLINCLKNTRYRGSKPKVLGRVAGSGNSDWVAQRLLFQPLRGILALTSELIIF